MLTKKAKYGLQALIYLAEQGNNTPVLIARLAEDKRIPRKFLEFILLEMKNEGLLDSKKGKGGGYWLARHPGEIRLGQVIRALDGPLAPVACVSVSAYKPCRECSDERCCGIRLVMKDVRDAIANVLDCMTLEDMILRSKMAGSETLLNYQI